MKNSVIPRVSARLRLNAFMAVIVSTLVVFTILFSACSNPAGSSSDDKPIPVISSPGAVPKYVASSYTGNDNNRIKYSYSYGGYDFYYIYLGTLKGIPMFYNKALYHQKGDKETYEFSREKIEESEIRRTVSQSSQTTKSVTNENTRSKTSGQQVGAELTQTFGASWFDMYYIEASLKISGEFSWSQVTSETIVNTYEQTNALTNAVEEATKRTISSRETYTRDLTDDPTGYYRFTYFTASDVYLYVIRDTESQKILYFEYRESATDDDFWRLDYSETASFTKSDATSFEIDTSFLNNLPPPGTVTVTFDKNNTDKGSTEANPQSKLVNLKAKVGVLPELPTRPGYTFVCWNTAKDGKGTEFTPTTSVTGNMTVYAMWADIATYKLTVNINPKEGGDKVTTHSNIQPGTPFSIEATDKKGYKFTNWTVVKGEATFANAKQAKTTVTLKTDATICANYQPNITLTVTQNIAAGGTVNPPSKSSGIAPGEAVTISATPNSGYKFDKWEQVKGSIEPKFQNPNSQLTTVTLGDDTTIRANFDQDSYTLTIDRYPKWGVIVKPQSGSSHPSNTKIDIEAKADKDYKFVCWFEPGRENKAKFDNYKSASTKVTLSDTVKIRAVFLPSSAEYSSSSGIEEIGKFNLKNSSGFTMKLHIKFLKDDGTWDKKTFNDSFTNPFSKTGDPGDKDIPDGAVVRIYSESIGGYDREGGEYFIYKKGSSKTAYYTHSGTTLVGNKLTFNEVK